MQIAILGPFEVRTDDGALADVPGARLRALLVALALEPGRVVPKATLIDWIWGEQPPADTANALQRLASRLRKALPDGLIAECPGQLSLQHHKASHVIRRCVSNSSCVVNPLIRGFIVHDDD